MNPRKNTETKAIKNNTRNNHKNLSRIIKQKTPVAGAKSTPYRRVDDTSSKPEANTKADAGPASTGSRSSLPLRALFGDLSKAKPERLRVLSLEHSAGKAKLKAQGFRV